MTENKQNDVNISVFNEKYRDVRGKTNSMYTYVLYRCTQNNLKEHIKKQINALNRISDIFKKQLFVSRYGSIQEFAEQYPGDYVYNSVLFVGQTIDQYLLTQDNINALKMFDHQKISYVYGDSFNIPYIEDLLFNISPYHMFQVNNNKIDYIYLTKTKKNIMNSKESKTLDIIGFVKSVLPMNSRYCIYGVSSKLRNNDNLSSYPLAYAVIPRHMRDDELIMLCDRIDQEDLLTELTRDLDMMIDMRYTHKIVFTPLKI